MLVQFDVARHIRNVGIEGRRVESVTLYERTVGVTSRSVTNDGSQHPYFLVSSDR